MFLKQRNKIAVLLILLSGLCWTLGAYLLQITHGTTADTMVPSSPEFSVVESEYPSETGNALASTTVTSRPTIAPADTAATSSNPADRGPAGKSAVRMGLGLVMVISAVAFAGAAVFATRQQKPLLGPDGACCLAALWAFAQKASGRWSVLPISDTSSGLLSGFIGAVVLILCTRELYNWIFERCSLSHCLVQRLALSRSAPQAALFIFMVWILLSLGAGLICLIAQFHRMGGYLLPACGFFVATAFGILCLWCYGSDLGHLKQQLRFFEQGQAVSVGKGAFSGTEEQLLALQTSHAEAIHTAVTSERFKVELIANVSHDLRTPLTSILGYSELLQAEVLSSRGQEQLYHLHRKAVYMNELVEDLFELTKVSSGVISKKEEQIDLIRLLEQTLGLFEDQLNATGIVVRRSYPADVLPLVTDGARMHRVFANLLGNAIKYALVGTRIYVEVQETERCYATRIVNTSSYEMDFQAEEILQRFVRGDKARTSKGSGLGLAIAQTYTESVGGAFRISVDGDQFSAIVELPKIERNI